MRALRISAGWAALAALWAAGVFWASSLPGALLGHPFFSNDKLLHALAYAAGAVLVHRALAPARLRPLRAALLAVAIAGAYGATDELHQAFVPGRSADPRDLAADVAGAALGATLGALLGRRAARHLAGQGGAG